MRRQIRRDSPRRIGRRKTMLAPAALSRTGSLSGAGCGLLRGGSAVLLLSPPVSDSDIARAARCLSGQAAAAAQEHRTQYGKTDKRGG
jgi:hypothetical protein